MSHNYDNWEKLVVAVLEREELRAIALSSSMDTISSISDGEETSSNHTTFSSSYSSIRDKSQLPVDYSDLMINHTDWKSLLPPDKNEIVWSSAHLSFSLDKRSGKNCFMIGAAGLLGHAECVHYRKSRFSEVARLNGLVDIRGRIEKQRLSPNTIYGAYLVFRFAKISHNSDIVDIFDRSSADVLSCERALESATATLRFVVDDETDFDEEVDHTEQMSTRYELKVVSREDGWKEIEMGEFYIGDEKQSGKVEARFETDKLLSSEISPIVEGIEFRPIVESTEFPRLYKYKISRLFGNFVWKTRKEEGRNLGANNETESSSVTELQQPRKRKIQFEGHEHMPSARKVLAVLGDDSKPLNSIKRRNFARKEESKPLFNHYKNGSGWWDENMEGVDHENVGSKEIWEGVGCTTLGGIEWD